MSGPLFSWNWQWRWSGDPFTQLLARAVQPTFTNTRAGARKSVFPDVGEIAANTPDLYTTVDGINVYSSMAGVTNLVDPDLTNWPTGGGRVNITESSHVYTLSFDGTGAEAVYTPDPASAALDRYGSFEARIVSGSISPGNNFVSFGSATGDKNGNFYDMENLTSEWQVVDFSVDNAITTDRVVLVLANSTPVDIEIRNMRAVDLSAPAAAFPDGSGAGATYGTDLLSASPTLAAQGTIYIPWINYGWSNDQNPIAVGARLLSATGYEVYLDASGFIRTTGGAISTKKTIDDTLTVAAVTWDGVNQTIRVDDETVVSVASAGVPSGTLYHGNNSGATAPGHAAGAPLIFDYVHSESEKDTFINGLTSRLSQLEGALI